MRILSRLHRKHLRYYYFNVIMIVKEIKEKQATTTTTKEIKTHEARIYNTCYTIHLI
jgi:hypothetical protein